MSDELLKLIHEGQYDQALRTAKRQSIDLLKQNQRGGAARALAAAGHVLCLLNSPTKAKSFAQEAYDLASRVEDPVAAGYALSVGALAQLRLAEFDQADGLMDRALEALTRHPDEEITAFARLISAELSLTKEDLAEARVFAEDAWGSPAAQRSPWIKARACLVKAVSEERADDVSGAIELLNQAEQHLKAQPDAETSWLVKAAMANACLKSRREKEAETHRREAGAIIEHLASLIPDEGRERFLKNPAIQNARGINSMTGSGMWKV
ncbi:MAG TPA: hypothetical protein VEN81_00460, partial [Planctomycetota bacterium]|nr:hypothetical protein [Planctomycetota bacterium]